MTPHVLIVDGSLTGRMDLRDAFEAAGVPATAVASGEAAADAMRERPYALVVLGATLAADAALAFVRTLRADPDADELPVLAIAPTADARDRLAGLPAGAVELLAGPYDRDRVVARAQARLDAGRAPTGAPVVIVIDDSATLRHAVGEALEGEGFDVVAAGSGEEGLRLAERIRPDLFVIDGQLPGISGEMVVHRIRMDAALRRVPCLLLTGSEGAVDELGALEAGADAYVRKRDGIGVILARARALVRARPAPAAFDGGRAGTVVLAIDADAAYQAALAAALAPEGYAVVAAADAATALAALGGRPVDAVLLDLALPDMPGTALCRHIKARPGWRDVPVAFVAAEDRPDALIEGLQAGADDYVAKGDGFEVLIGRLRAHLRRKRFEDENRVIREALLRNELESAEARAATATAEAGALATARFLATMSHEIRTPLNAMLGAAELLGDARLDEGQRAYVDLLRRAGAHLLAIVNDVLDLSKIEAGRVELERTPFALGEVLGRVVALARIPADEKGLAVTCEVAPGVPEALVGDPLRLGQVLGNLVGNAVKFTPAGGVTLAVAPGDPADPYVLRFAVTDTGIGVPAAKRAAIFEAFAQADSSTTRHHGGTGLGLAIARRLVALMGGVIALDSTEGVGSTFWFMARFAPGVPRPASPAPPAPPAPEPVRAGLAILLAEDLADNRLIFEAFLAGSPHRLAFAANGREAVDQVQAGRFDLVLMDMQMPVMDGYEATAAIRRWERDEGRPRLPIVALTASVLRHELARCLAAGCDATLGKPIGRKELLAALAAHAAPDGRPAEARGG